MNLVDFHVKEIIEEEFDKLYKLYGMTYKELQEEKDKDYNWYEHLLHKGCKQKYRYVDMGGEGTDYAFFDLEKDEKPYKVGDTDMH